MGNGTSKQFEGKERKSGGGGTGVLSPLLSVCVSRSGIADAPYYTYTQLMCIGPYNLTLGSLWLLIYLCMAVALEKKNKSIPFGLGVQLTTPEQS